MNDNRIYWVVLQRRIGMGLFRVTAKPCFRYDFLILVREVCGVVQSVRLCTRGTLASTHATRTRSASSEHTAIYLPTSFAARSLHRT